MVFDTFITGFIWLAGSVINYFISIGNNFVSFFTTSTNFINWVTNNVTILVYFHFFMRLTDKEGLGEGIQTLISDYMKVIEAFTSLCTRILSALGALIPFT